MTQFGDAAFSLTLSTDTQAVSYVAQENAVDVISNTAWSWETDADWIDSDEDLTQNEDGLSPVSEFTYSVTENTTGSARTGRITFVTAEGNVSSVLEVTQLSSTLDTLTLEFTEIALEQRADSFELVRVNSNTDWNYSISSTNALLNEGQTEADYNGADPNGSYVGGDGAGPSAYEIGDIITLSGGFEVTVSAVDGNGDVTNFTVNNPNYNTAEVGDTLIQISLDGAGTGTAFALTVGSANIQGSWLTSGEDPNQNGNEFFVFGVTENTFAKPRTAEINFETASGEAFATLVVTQAGTTLDLSLSQITVGQDGLELSQFSDLEITVSSNTDWSWSSDQPWLSSVERVNDSGNRGNFDIGVEENNTGITRVGTLTFTSAAGDIVRTLVVTQAGTLTLSETEHVNTSIEQSRDFTVFAGPAVSWTWSSDATWLRGVDETTGDPEALQQSGLQEFGYLVDANTTSETRVATITFLTTSGGESASIQVTQLPSVVINLTLSNDQQATTFAEQERQVRVFSNTSWVWESSDPSWLTGVDEGLEQNDNQVFTYKVTQNNNSGSRTADLVFTTTTGNVIATLTVTQLGGPGTDGLAVAPEFV